MAAITRTAKAGAHWKAKELLAYNVTFTTLVASDFFGSEPDTNLDALDQDMLNYAIGQPDDHLSDDLKRMMDYLYSATSDRYNRDSHIVAFAKELLGALQYLDSGLIHSSYFAFAFQTCKKFKKAELAVCVESRAHTIAMILQRSARTDSGRASTMEPEAQLVAGAIAAFQGNNKVREARQLPLLDEMVFPGITFNDARPAFYVIPVTRALSDAVADGVYPADATNVVKCAIPWPGTEGMEDPAYRRIALQYFVAFRTLAKELWTAFLV